MKWLFSPVHNTVQMTPVTCFTTLICLLLPAYFIETQDRLADALVFAGFTALVIASVNLGVHELWWRYEKRKAKHD